jgi:hypothetical protein
MARARYLSRDDRDQEQMMADAGEAYRAAAEVARSSAPALAGMCRRGVEEVGLAFMRATSPEAAVKRTLEACAAALRANPDDSDVLCDQGSAWEFLGRSQAERGVDSTQAFANAVDSAGRAVRLAPTNIHAHRLLASVYVSIGQYRSGTGADPVEPLDRGIEIAKRALALDPVSYEVMDTLAEAYTYRAFEDARHGRDPRAFYTAQIELADAMRKQYPSSLAVIQTLETAYVGRAIWQRDHGVDPTESLDRSAAASRDEIAAYPNAANGYVNLCDEECARGTHLLRVGGDARAAFTAALAACRGVSAGGDEWWILHVNLGLSYAGLAAVDLDRGGDPVAQLARARGEIARSLQLSFNAMNAHDFGETQVLAARNELAHGRDPAAALEAAEEMIRRGLALDAKDGSLLRLQAVIARWRGEWLAAHHRPVDAILANGLARATQSEALLPDAADGFAAEGALHLVAARTATRPAERLDAASKARAALTHALTINRFLERQLRPLLDEATRLAAR